MSTSVDRFWVTEYGNPFRVVRCTCGKILREKSVLGHVAQQRRFGHEHPDPGDIGFPEGRAVLRSIIKSEGLGL